MDDEKLGNQFDGKEVYVKDVFTEIASYYDEMNGIMSMGMIRRWHKFMMKKLGNLQGKRCLDVGTGTGEIAFLVARKAAGGEVIGLDITPAMLELAKKKMTDLGIANVEFVVGDALDIRMPDGTFDAVTSGYMLRNVTDIPKAVGEMHRMLKVGGRCVVAELARPGNRLVKPFYNFYINRVIPHYGRKYDKGMAIDGKQPAYDWLTSSIEGFPYGDAMVEIFRKAGFRDAKCYVKSFGAVNIYVASKEA